MEVVLDRPDSRGWPHAALSLDRTLCPRGRLDEVVELAAGRNEGDGSSASKLSSWGVNRDPRTGLSGYLIVTPRRSTGSQRELAR